MKRTLSLILCLVLVLGLLPAAALADGNTAGTLPEDYSQMYVKTGDNNYGTVAEIEAGNSTDILFYIKTGDSYVELNTTEKPDGSNGYVYKTNGLTVTCSNKSLGTTGAGMNGTNWIADNALPGATGYLYTEITSGDTTTKYAIAATISAPIVGVYSDSALSNYLIFSKRSFEYSAEAKPTVYLAAGSENVTITGISGENIENLSFTVLSNGTCSVTVSEKATGNFTAKLTVTLSNSNNYNIELTFNAANNENSSASLKTGLYTSLTNGQLGGYTEMSKIHGEDGPSGYNVGYTRNQSVTVYYYHPTKTCSTASNYVNITDVAAADVGGLTGVQAITLKENLTGTLEVDITRKNISDDSDGGGFPIVFSDGYSQMYYQFSAENYFTDIELRPGSNTELSGKLFTDQAGKNPLDLSNYTLSLSNEALGNIVTPENGKIVWTAQNVTSNVSGFLLATSKSSNAENYVIAVSVKKPVSLKLYRDLEGTIEIPSIGNGSWAVSFTDGASTSVYLRIVGDNTASFAPDAEFKITVTPKPDLNVDIASSTLLNDNKVLKITHSESDSSGGSSEHFFVINGQTVYFKLSFVPEGEEPAPDYVRVSSQRPLTNDDKLSYEEMHSIEIGPVPFQYDADGNGTPETYYLCTMARNDKMDFLGSVGRDYHEGIMFNREFRMGIWTETSTDNYSLVDADTKKTLVKAFSNWSVKAYNELDRNTQDYLAKDYPAIYTWNDSDGWPFNVMFAHSETCIGDWTYKFSAEIGGQTVTMYATSSFFFVSGINKEYTAESVAAANAKIQEWSEAGIDASYNIYLPAGEFNGIISVPYGFVVNIIGSSTDHRTILNGGIGGDGSAFVENIDFVGCGWRNTNWPNDEIYKGAPNYGLYPADGGAYYDCTFKNYHHALHSGTDGTHMRYAIFGGSGSLFENNYIALYMNSANHGGGRLEMVENTFRHNGCAIWWENYGDMLPLNYFKITRCRFYDNGWDLINLTGRCYFIPGQLFERDGKYGQGKFTNDRNAISHNGPSPRAVDPYASTAVTNASESGSGVYTFPVATDNTFKKFDYSNSNAVIANFNTSSWLIPENDLNGKTITVIQDDKGADVTIWTFGEEKQ